MNYKQETGAIISPNREILHLFDGNPGSVDFDPEVIWAYHQQNPGSVFALAHVHPNGMFNLSGTDEHLLKGWAIALYPWPIRVITIAKSANDLTGTIFIETHYLGQVESKEEWLKRKAVDPLVKSRHFEIVKSYQHKEIIWKQEINMDFYGGFYGDILIKRSYSEN